MNTKKTTSAPMTDNLQLAQELFKDWKANAAAIGELLAEDHKTDSCAVSKYAKAMGVSHGLVRNLLAIGHKQLIPEAFYIGTHTKSYAIKMTHAKQLEYLTKGVAVYSLYDDSHSMVALYSLAPDMLKVAFDKDTGLWRGMAAQKNILQERRDKSKAATTARINRELHIHNSLTTAEAPKEKPLTKKEHMKALKGSLTAADLVELAEEPILLIKAVQLTMTKA